MAAVDYSLKQCKVAVWLWSVLTLLVVALIAMTLVIPGEHGWQVAWQMLILCAYGVFLRSAIQRLSRARARSEREEWEVVMHEAMRN